MGLGLKVACCLFMSNMWKLNRHTEELSNNLVFSPNAVYKYIIVEKLMIRLKCSNAVTTKITYHKNTRKSGFI